MKISLRKISDALRENGVLYASFKYGDGEREENGKHYSDYTEKDIPKLLEGTGLSFIETWNSDDSLGRDVRWLNLIAVKN